MRQQIQRSFVVLMIFASCVSAALLLADDKDRWYSLDMAGGKAGWMHTTESDADGKITTHSVTSFSLNRAAAGVAMTIETTFIETSDGKPISMSSIQNLGQSPITQTYVFKPESVELTSEQGGNKKTTTLPLPKDAWLTPGAAERYSLQRFKSGAKEIVVRTIDPTQGLSIVTSKRTGFEPSTIQALGRDFQATKTTVEISVMPGMKSTEFLDDEGELLRSETNIGGILPVVMTISTKEQAQGKGSGPAPEIMLSTFIHPDRKIPNARTSTKGVYVVSVKEGDVPSIPETGAQHVEKQTDGSLKVTIDRATSTPADAKAASDPKYLAPTALCNATDEKIVELAAKAVQGLPQGKDAPEADRAEAIREFVYRYITKKDLDVGFASASEVARTREGDCTEHGVLTAALLRAQHIPSRVCSGLLYVDQFAGGKFIFGYHMWAEALLTIDGSPRWVDLDGTLPGTRPFDATHIALAVSALEDGDMMGGMASVATGMGRLKIHVESTE